MAWSVELGRVGVGVVVGKLTQLLSPLSILQPYLLLNFKLLVLDPSVHEEYKVYTIGEGRKSEKFIGGGGWR